MNDAHSVTETDLAVAAAIYPVLMECARQSPAEKLTYGELIKRAQTRFPAIDAIQKAIPVSLGGVYIQRQHLSVATRLRKPA